jgi:hypothetical protein
VAGCREDRAALPFVRCGGECRAADYEGIGGCVEGICIGVYVVVQSADVVEDDDLGLIEELGQLERSVEGTRSPL